MKTLLLLLSFKALFAFTITVPTAVKQVVYVPLDQPNQNHALLYTYERSEAKAAWKEVLEPISVSLGRNGIGLGLGIASVVTDKNLPNKKEGDGKSPAGIFKLSKVFGYAATTINANMPYLHLDKDLHCVDDSNSSYYNQIITKQKAYNSFEIMRRKDNLYKWGIIVEHNKQAQAGKGSCIFIHIMKADKSPTAGCTAMTETDLHKIILWLNKNKHPVLVQSLKY